MIFPDQTIPEKDKNDAWKKLHLDYAQALLRNFNPTRAKITRLLDSYMGIVVPGSRNWLERNYGKRNKAEYITYRLGRSKVDLLHGEWLKRPLSATVTTINSDALSAKMAQLDAMVGAMHAKGELTDLKEKAGVDVMEGAPIPNGPDDPVWQQMSPKDKCEDIMQIILDNQVLDLDAKKKIADAFLKLIITNRCACQVEIDREGEVQLNEFDSRDAIFEEIEGDDYVEKSPIKGRRRTLPIHQILLTYDLTKEQRDTLNNARNNHDVYCGDNGLSRGYMRWSNGQLMCDVIHIEWDSVTPEYYKIVPKSKDQSVLDGESDSPNLELPIDPIKYESNKAYHDANVAKGLYTVVTKYKQDQYEATRIGGLVDVNMRRTFFQKRSVDKPAYILSSSYYFYVHGRINGISVSLQQIIENFDNMFDIIMYQILKDLARAKGKVFTFDRAGLPINRSVKDVMYNIANDQFYEYDSSAAGNVGGRTFDPTNAFKEMDMGLSASFQYLLAMKQDVINTLSQITGINPEREGNTSASSTATNAQTDISNSRAITEALFYGMSGFVSRVMKGIVHSSAISWAFYKLEKGEQILGAGKFKFLQMTREVGYRDYGVHIEDGGRYMEIKQDIKQMMELSLNAKEIRPMDALNVLLANNVAEMKAKLESSWIEMQKVMQQSQQAEQQSQAQQQQQTLQTQVQMTMTQQQDREAAEQKNIVLKGQVQKDVDNNKAKNEMYKSSMESETDLLNQPPV